MKVVVFGASSATGRLVIEKALEKGYEVTAFVRDEGKLGLTASGLSIVRGDALNAAHVEEAVRGNDVVLSVLGPKGKPSVMAAESTKNIIQAMQKHGLKRLVVVSVAGVSVAQDRRKPNVVDGLIELLLKDVFADRVNQLAVLEASHLEWVAVRVPRLTNNPMRGSVRAFFGNLSPGFSLTRTDLADFMLQQLTSDEWLRQAPIVSN